MKDGGRKLLAHIFVGFDNSRQGVPDVMNGLFQSVAFRQQFRQHGAGNRIAAFRLHCQQQRDLEGFRENFGQGLSPFLISCRTC